MATLAAEPDRHGAAAVSLTLLKTQILGLLFLASLTACVGTVTPEKQASDPTSSSGVFVPTRAKDVRQREGQGVRDVTYVVGEPYPASRLLCELTNYLDQEKWQGLREDVMNAGSPSSLVDGWGSYEDATRQPQRQVHGWAASWSNDAGDVVSYSLRYEYPDGAKRDLITLHVAAQLWPAEIANMMLGDRATHLPALRAPLVNHVFGVSRSGPCDTPPWTDFVTQKLTERAILGLPSGLGEIRSIDIQHDIDGLAERIATALNKRVPNLRISTVHKRLSEPSDATLDFNVVCRCNENGAPDGFYVREAVLYKPAIELQWQEPPRVLFYWSDGGSPMWRKVPSECFGRKDLSTPCRAAFQDADIAFVADLAPTLDNAWRQR